MLEQPDRILSLTLTTKGFGGSPSTVSTGAEGDGGQCHLRGRDKEGSEIGVERSSFGYMTCILAMCVPAVLQCDRTAVGPAGSTAMLASELSSGAMTFCSRPY